MDKKVQYAAFYKGHYLLQMGSVARNLYFIHKGAAHGFYIKKEKEITAYFALDGQFIGVVESLFTQQPSQRGVQLLEDTQLYFIPYQDLEFMCHQYHEIERLVRKMMTVWFYEGHYFIENNLFLSVRERYKELEKMHPGISNRIPLKYIASYLGTTQTSLSRIRANTQ